MSASQTSAEVFPLDQKFLLNTASRFCILKVRNYGKSNTVGLHHGRMSGGKKRSCNLMLQNNLILQVTTPFLRVNF